MYVAGALVLKVGCIGLDWDGIGMDGVKHSRSVPKSLESPLIDFTQYQFG